MLVKPSQIFEFYFHKDYREDHCTECENEKLDTLDGKRLVKLGRQDSNARTY